MAGEGDPPRIGHLWVVGAGRVGLALGLLLRRRGVLGSLTYTGRSAAAPAHPLFQGPDHGARYLSELAPPHPAADAVLIAVPDAEVPAVAEALARQSSLPHVPVLHTSGALDADALRPLKQLGHSTGSLHPLVAVADPVAGADLLAGAWYALEGQAAARAVGEQIVRGAGGRVLDVRPGSKSLYHAGAVFASNYLVSLLAVAERLLVQAGAAEADAREALAGLAEGAVRNLRAHGPVDALTGPIQRGDVDTVARHLARLSAPDRALYSVLARETLALARRRGLAPDDAARLEQLLEEGK